MSPTNSSRLSESSPHMRHLMKLLTLSGPSGDEGPVAQYLASQLKRAKIPASRIQDDGAHRRSQLGGQCGNLILKLPGSVRGSRRLFSAHMDTVPICSGARPVRKGNRITPADRATGLGGDNRAGCAVLLATALEVVQRDLPHPPLTFLWAVQEEVGLHGARHVKKTALGRPQMGFNYDGGGANELTIGATGGYRMQITVEGLASHAGAHPEQGVSAVAAAALAVAELHEQGWHGLIEKGRRRGTSNVGFIAGGEATNVVTDRVELRAEARSHDSKFRERIVSEFEKAFQRAARKVKNVDGRSGRATVEGRLDYKAFLLRRSEPCVKAAAAAVRECGLEVDYRIANGGLDANWLTAHGIPTVSLGCGQKNIHTVDEWLDLKQFDHACQVALQLATCV